MERTQIEIVLQITTQIEIVLLITSQIEIALIIKIRIYREMGRRINLSFLDNISMIILDMMKLRNRRNALYFDTKLFF